MSIRLATWNINSVRLRISSVVRFLEEYTPDILCLQETKCPMGQFPTADLKACGYGHIAENGQPGYHGVAIVSRLPLENIERRQFCGKNDARHIAASFPAAAGLRVHSLYIPAGGDVPDPAANEKFAHKLNFLNELTDWFAASKKDALERTVLAGDFNIAPLEHDVWSHKQLLKVVSHTPVEVEHLERMRSAAGWVDVMRQHVPHDQKLYTWWSYRSRDWSGADKGRRLDHIWLEPDLAKSCKHIEVVRAARGWPRPSDHAPVLAELDL